MTIRALLAMLLLASLPCHAQSVRYVTDDLKLEARSGPSLDNRIVRMLDSGTRVEVLEESDGWSRIALDDGDGWMLSRFLMDEPSARDRVDAAMSAREQAEALAAQLREELERSVAAIGMLEEERDALTRRLDELSREYDELRRTAGAAVSMQDENRRLKAESSSMREELEALSEERLLLQRRQEREWFLAGAGVLLGGMLLGLIIPKIRWKRRRGWGEL